LTAGSQAHGLGGDWPLLVAKSLHDRPFFHAALARTGLDRRDSGASIRAQAVGKHAPRRPGADDNKVEFGPNHGPFSVAPLLDLMFNRRAMKGTVGQIYKNLLLLSRWLGIQDVLSTSRGPFFLDERL
jgi:hypothetical protein